MQKQEDQEFQASLGCIFIMLSLRNGNRFNGRICSEVRDKNRNLSWELEKDMRYEDMPKEIGRIEGHLRAE